MQAAVRWSPVAAVAGIIALLWGCSALPFDFAQGRLAQDDMPPSAPSATSGDLLYVANKGASEGVSVLTFPQGTLVATIKQIGRVLGICSDTSGNVWMTTLGRGSGPFHAYKFRHGGTKPVEVRNSPRSAYGCAVDPTTGNLALISYGGSSDGAIEIWPGARLPISLGIKNGVT